MKRFFRILSIALLCGALSTPAISAQRHGGNNGGRERTTHSNRGNNGGSRSPQNNRPNNRPANSTRPNNNGGSTGRPGIGNQRPGNKDHGVNNGNNNNHRPNFGNGNNNNNNRPNVGNGNHNNNRPNVGNGNHNNNHPNVGNGNHNNNRPNVGNGNHGSTGRPGLGTAPNHRPDYRPDRPNDGNHNWNHGNRPGNHPGNGLRPNNRPNRPGIGNRPPAPRPPYMAPPRRPFRPNMYRPHYRPTPPPHWRPVRGIPAIRGILGITFGTTIGLSLDYLYNSGYTVDGYGNDVVYLRNVNQLNYIWTDAALYYGANGFDASSFYYATPVYDLTRYNAVYNNLVALYGQPISINSAGQLGATWFGGNQGYITLSFGASNVAGGALRYLTTLTFGL